MQFALGLKQQAFLVAITLRKLGQDVELHLTLPPLPRPQPAAAISAWRQTIGPSKWQETRNLF